MKKMIEKNREVILYIVFGVLTTVVNYVVYFVFRRLFGVHYLLSNAVAWIVAVAFAYITNKLYVFEKRENRNVMREFIEFVAGRVGTGIVEMVLLFILVDFMRTNDIVAKIIIGVIVVVLNYFISKFFVFNEK